MVMAAAPQPPTTVVIEIPAGTTDKIEYDATTDRFLVDRVIRYLPYPVNYGFIPRTLAGDRDPVDVLLLSRRVETGTRMEAVPLATLRLTDRGESDEKVLFIPVADSLRLNACDTWACLRDGHPDLLLQIETWFLNYKGPGVMVSDGWMGPDSTRQFIRNTMLD
jgi:inorganic pyrophosphatase